MKNFFSVILIIAVSVFIFALYYFGKSFYLKYKERINNSEIQKKRYENEKKYIRNHIRHLLNELENGKISWILISSCLYPEIKLEVIYNSLKKSIQIRHRMRNVNPDELRSLKKLGLQTVDINNDLFCINVSLNSTIVTDIVYFILEHINDQKYALNIKVVTSGGES